MSDSEQLDRFFSRLEALLDRVESLLPSAVMAVDWSAPAYRWRKRGSAGYLQPVTKPHRIAPEDLQEIDRQRLPSALVVDFLIPTSLRSTLNSIFMVQGAGNLRHQFVM